MGCCRAPRSQDVGAAVIGLEDAAVVSSGADRTRRRIGSHGSWPKRGSWFALPDAVAVMDPFHVVRPDDLHTFQVLPRRSVVKGTVAWITRCWRTVRDYERLAAHHETVVYWAMIITMSRRLARQRQVPQPCITSAGRVVPDAAP